MSSRAPPSAYAGQPTVKKPWTPKIDKKKFSKLLCSHCLEAGHLIPPLEFLADLDAFANGEITPGMVEAHAMDGDHDFIESPDSTQVVED